MQNNSPQRVSKKNPKKQNNVHYWNCLKIKKAYRSTEKHIENGWRNAVAEEQTTLLFFLLQVSLLNIQVILEKKTSPEV